MHASVSYNLRLEICLCIRISSVFMCRLSWFVSSGHIAYVSYRNGLFSIPVLSVQTTWSVPECDDVSCTFG